ncbi:MAG: prepilin-type N-terminal cleavage/methylation domain-containing protein [Candidatus Omnitrophota bacterium]
MSNKFRTGFTMIEVMVATVVLSLGTVLIYEIFFKSLDISRYCSNYLNVVSWADERIWQAQDDVSRFGDLVNISSADDFISNEKEFHWNLSYNLLDMEAGLFRIDGSLSWQEGERKRKISRTAYALYTERE